MIKCPLNAESIKPIRKGRRGNQFIMLLSPSKTCFYLAIGLLLAIQIALPASTSAQDLESLIDVHFANGECYKNYEVSYRITERFNPPINSNKTADKDVQYFDSIGNPVVQLKEERGRLIVNKGEIGYPQTILFIRNYRQIGGRQDSDRSEIFHWENMVSRSIRKGVSPARFENSDISTQQEVELKEFYKRNLVPHFEYFNTRLIAPPIDEFWKDRKVYPDYIKSNAYRGKMTKGPTGRIRWERQSPSTHTIAEYDPVSNLPVFTSHTPIDPLTKEVKLNETMRSDTHWEKERNVYRPKHIISRERMEKHMYNKVSVFHWDQFNEEEIRFPEWVQDGFSLDNGLKYLSEGQLSVAEDPR